MRQNRDQGDRQREGPRDHKRSGTEAQEPKGSKAGNQESKAKSKGQYGPRPGVGGVTLPEANQRGDCVVSE